MSVYTRAASRSLAALTKRGATATLNRYTPTINVKTGAVTKGAATSTFPTYAIELPNKGKTFIAGTLVAATSTILFVAASGATFDPVAGDEIVWGTPTYLIKTVEKLAPDRTAIAYTLEAVVL